MIKIIGDVEKAKKALGTNINLYKDQILNGEDKKMKSLCQKYPDLFKWIDGSWEPNSKKGNYKNKMMDKAESKNKSFFGK